MLISQMFFRDGGEIAADRRESRADRCSNIVVRDCVTMDSNRGRPDAALHGREVPRTQSGWPRGDFRRELRVAIAGAVAIRPMPWTSKGGGDRWPNPKRT